MTAAPGSGGAGAAGEASPVTIAVDTNGADLGPAEVGAGAAIAARQGVRTLLFGPADQFGDIDAPEGLVEIVDAPVSIAKV
ncbi:MAG: phosphate acyltransferase, partial [Baekduia sp.]|nr:phosphate acyltransferase [Baekduia sp.]